jgi:molecular chaperone Hsp33
MPSAEGSVAVRVLVASNLVREAARRHATSPTASVALGRSLMGALLLATESQGGERVQLQIRGDGPIGSITVTATGSGEVRGYVTNPDASPSPLSDRLDVASAVGLGTLSVERNHPAWKRPYSGIVPLVHGTIARDLALYLLESEQKHSAVALGVHLDRDARVDAAAGYLVQGLPDAEEGALAEVEGRVGELPNPSELVLAGAGAEDIARRLLAGLGMGAVSRLHPRFHCPCGVERIRRAAQLLGPEELRDIVARGEEVEVRCHFCNEVYHLSPDQIGSVLRDA